MSLSDLPAVLSEDRPQRGHWHDRARARRSRRRPGSDPRGAVGRAATAPRRAVAFAVALRIAHFALQQRSRGRSVGLRFSVMEAPSTKIWPRERDDNGISLFADHQLIVPRWHGNEQHAVFNKGMWRRTPRGGELEIKGAILGPDTAEYIPEGKRDRSCQIHRFGFS